MSNDFSTDVFFKSYLRDNERFADMMNTAVFHGEPVVDFRRLKTFDTDVSLVIDAGGEKVLTINRLRDKVKEIDMGDYVLIMGIEIQKTIDQRMATRVLVYDAFLINIYSREKPCVVLTLVLYLGEKHWYAKTNLLDELKVPEKYREGLNNWEMNFIDINRTNPSIFKNKDNQDVTKLIQVIYRWDGDREVFKHLRMSREVILAAVSATNSYQLLEELLSLEETSLKEGDYMSEAVDRAIEKAAQKVAQEMVQKAVKEAEQKSVIRSIVRQLLKKMKPLSNELKERLSIESIENLEQILDAVPDFRSEQDIWQFLAS